MNDTYMKKLVSLNQLTRDMSDGDKYYMSPHINGDQACPWKLQKRKQEKAESIKSRKTSISQAPKPLEILNNRDQQYLEKFNKDMMKTIEKIELKNSPRVFEPLQRIDEQTLQNFNKHTKAKKVKKSPYLSHVSGVSNASSILDKMKSRLAENSEKKSVDIM